MGDKAEKITVTRHDVMAAMTRPNVSEMGTVADIARWVVTMVYGVEKVYDGNTAMWHVKQADLRRLLASMADDGTLILRTGQEWYDRGAPTWLGRSNGHYYVLPEKAEEWAKEKAAKVAEVRQQQADHYAKGLLAERHSDEYDALVAEFYAKLEKGQSDG
jgi:hypothetical protein